jgi:putative membrane fusion protein
MKAGSPGTKILMMVICLAILAYFGIQAYRYFNDTLDTTVAYSYQVEDSTTVSGYIVRDERVLPDNGGGLLRLSRSEGEKVSKGGEIARIYANQASLDKQEQIDSLKTQIEQLEYAREVGESSQVSLRLDNQIAEGILALQSDLTADRLDSADSRISQLRSLVLKRDYAYSDADDLNGQLAALQAKLKTLQSSAASSARIVTAPVSGIYSAVVDGFESVLTPDMLKTLTPSALTQVKKDGSASSDLGKLILGDSWYYAATLSDSDAEKLTVGKNVTLRFAKGTDRNLSARLDFVSEKEDGRVAAVFSSDQYLPELTLLRRQSADIVRDTVSGLRVPSDAVRVDETGTTGLYCVVGMVVWFKPVKVLYTGDGFVLVRADTDVQKRILRAGDAVVISANALYDGKVVS